MSFSMFPYKYNPQQHTPESITAPWGHYIQMICSANWNLSNKSSKTTQKQRYMVVFRLFCFLPYAVSLDSSLMRKKQGKLFYAQLTTWSSIRAEDRFVSRFAWA